MENTNKTVVITGVSSGIGYALANHFLSEGNKVVGIGRTNSIQQDNFTFYKHDLAVTTDFSFLENAIKTSKELILINNAGTIGNIERISEQVNSDIEQTIRVNTIAPMLLCQYVLQKFSIELPLTIINISSGAGKHPIPSWASYCASKAAIDLFSQTIYLEEQERSRNIKVYSVSPGVVDTSMQEKIRNANHTTFSSLNSFIELKEQDKLTSLDTIVKKMKVLLEKKYSDEIIYSLRDILI